MKTKYLLPVLLLAGLVACSKEEAAAPAASEPVQTETVAETTPAPAEAAPAPADTAVLAGDAIGIADCDDFLNAYQACVTEKVPVENRGVLEEGVKQWRQSWKDMAANEGMRPVLPEVCNRARESAKAGLSAYGCTF